MAIFSSFMPGVGWAQAAANSDAGKKPDAARLPAAKEVIAKYVKAIGGKEALLKRTSTHVKGKFQIPAQGVQGTLELFARKPEFMLVKIEVPGLGQILTGYDGKVGWTIDPAMGPMIMEGNRLTQLKDQANYYAILHDEKDFKSMETVARAKFEDKDCYQLKLVKQSGQETSEFFDAQSGLQLGHISSQELAIGPAAVTSIMADYKKFGDLQIASRVTQKMAGIEQVMTIDSIEYDQVPPSVFELPAQIKALVKK